ncbi:MAG TPA: MauE/DoxX family redox-associated membrane protein [Pyrinomonadaceae bacterium]|jgi:uncharacterized membrane protein
MRSLQLILKYILALFFVLAGLNHFRAPDFYLRMMPPYLPWHLLLVYLSGVFEMALGLMLLFPKYQRMAAWGLIALLVAVFPANIQMAVNPGLYPEFGRGALWARLPLQAVLIAWAYWYARPASRKNSH